MVVREIDISSPLGSRIDLNETLNEGIEGERIEMASILIGSPSMSSLDIPSLDFP